MTQPRPPSSVSLVTDTERARHLIPGFLKKTLAADDKEWMTQFLNILNHQGGPAAVDLAQEIAWVERSQQQLAQDAPAFDAQAGWQRLQSRLDAPAQPVRLQVTPLEMAMRRLKTQIRIRADSAIAWWQKPMVGVLAAAMIVTQMGLLAAVVKQMDQVTPVTESVSPASGAPSLDGMKVLTIVFKDSASLLDVRTLIDNVQGRVIDGPGALGVWRVAVPKDKLDASLMRLGAAKAVESVASQ